MALKIFVSHAAADVDLAKALVDCLLSCFEIPDADIRCTSVPGHKLPVGADVASTLKNDLSDSAVVIGLLTPSAVSSSWVLFELGAAWGAAKRILPIVGAGLDFSDLPGPLGGHHAVRASDENGMTQLLDELQQVTGVVPRSRAKAQDAIAKFVRSQANSAAGTPKPPPRARAVKTKVKEPAFGGIPFSELFAVLASERITVPTSLARTDKPVETTLLELFVSGAEIFATGVTSTQDVDTAQGFFYHKLAPKLLPFQLVKFDKLPASRYYRQISLSATGKKFIAHWKRLAAKKTTK